MCKIGPGAVLRRGEIPVNARAPSAVLGPLQERPEYLARRGGQELRLAVLVFSQAVSGPYSRPLELEAADVNVVYGEGRRFVQEIVLALHRQEATVRRLIPRFLIRVVVLQRDFVDPLFEDICIHAGFWVLDLKRSRVGQRDNRLQLQRVREYVPRAAERVVCDESKFQGCS